MLSSSFQGSFSRSLSLFVSFKLNPQVVSLLKQHFTDIEVSTRNQLPHSFLVEKAKSCDVLLTYPYDKIDSSVLDSKKLKFVSVFGAGTDNINIPYATKRGILLANVHQSLADTCADTLISLFLAVSRHVVEADNYVHDRKWTSNDVNATVFWGLDMHHKTMGIVGAGHIGRAVARRAQGFEMKILYNDILPEYSPLTQLLKESDFLAICCPLTPQTHKLISEKEFRLMKPTAIIGNIGRGAIIDTDALVEAISRKKIYGAALDVTDPEPLPVNHPLLDQKNIVISPHFGSGTRQTRLNMAL
jgi:glyoxylate reductase